MYRHIYKMGFLSLLVMLTTSCYMKAIPEIYLKKSGNITMELNKETHGIVAMDLSQDGRYLLAGDVGFRGVVQGSIRVWDMTEGCQLSILKSLTETLRTVAILPDGKYAVEGGRGIREIGSRVPSLAIWDITTGNLLKETVSDYYGSWTIDKVAYTRDGKYFLAAEKDCLHIFDAKTGNIVKTLPPGEKPGKKADSLLYFRTAAAFSPDGKQILSGGPDAVVHLWDVETGKEIRQFHGHKKGYMGGINSIAFTPDGRYALTGSSHDDHVKLWDVKTGVEVRRFSGFQGVSGMYTDEISLSPDGRYASILALPLKIWDIHTGKSLAEFQYAWKGIQTATTGTMRYHPNGRYILMAVSESAIRIYDVKTGKEIAVLIGFDDGEWLVITSEGYYNSSKKGAEYLGVKIGDQTYNVDRFYDVFYRPDIVKAKLRGDDISGLVTITMQDAIKSPPTIVEFSSSISDTDKPKINVCYQVKSTGGGIGEVRLFQNGKLIQSDGYYKDIARSTSGTTQLASFNSNAIYEDMRSIVIKGDIDTPVVSQSKGDTFEACSEVETVPGENEISLMAFNRNNTAQSYMKTVRFHSKLKQEEPHLYILSIGINRYKDEKVNLKYAVKDAGDIQNRLLKQSATLYKAANIHYDILTSEQATKENIFSKINDLSKVIKPTDAFILFVAGHGVLLQNQYYVLTHDYDGTISDRNTINSNAIIEMSKKIKSLSQLFIFDTCHAGGVDSIISGLYDARMSVLAKKMGLHIYASASDKQATMDGYKGNGLFTYTLLDGLNNNKEADKNKDGRVSIVGLGGYSKKMTTNISKEIGHEQTPLIINFGKDSPIYKLQ